MVLTKKQVMKYIRKYIEDSKVIADYKRALKDGYKFFVVMNEQPNDFDYCLYISKSENIYNTDNVLDYDEISIETLFEIVKGSNYKVNKAWLEELAIEVSNNRELFDFRGGEYRGYALNDFFYENGKKYGLLKVFKENCIC